MAKKDQYISDVLKFINTVAHVMDEARKFDEMWQDNSYSSGISDSDLEDYGVTAAQLTSCITCFQQIENFARNQVVTQGDYSATINVVRGAVSQTSC